MASGDKEIQATLDAVDEGVITFQEAVVKLQKKIYDRLLMFQKDLIITNGTIVNSAKNIKLLSGLKKQLENIIFDESDFSEAIKDFANVYDVVTDLNSQYFKALEKNFSPPKIIDAVRQQSVSLVIEGLSDSGLDSNFINPVREIINNYVTTGGSYTQLSKELDNYINGYSSDAGQVDGQMTRYTKQITTDAINQYTATINELTSSDLGWDWFKYVGSNIKTSRTFCIALTEKKYYHRSELAQIIKGNFTEFKQMKGEIYDKTKLPQGMYEDTNTSNFQVYRGGYNCGHQAYPIPNSSVPKKLLSLNKNEGELNIDSLIKSTAIDSQKIHKGNVEGYERSVYRDFDGLNERNTNLKTTEQLKKEVGAYISTEKIYGKENVLMPQDVKYHIQDLGKSKVDDLINKSANKTINVDDINIVQQYVFEKPLKKAINSKNYKVVVYKYKGKYYLNDGNHRVAAAKLNNIKDINVVIEDVTSD